MVEANQPCDAITVTPGPLHSDPHAITLRPITGYVEATIGKPELCNLSHYAMSGHQRHSPQGLLHKSPVVTLRPITSYVEAAIGKHHSPL